MKKWFAVLITLILCLPFSISGLAEQTNDYTVGSIVTLGSYEQDNNLDNGTEPVEWIVLGVQDNQALLISKYCLDARAYNKDYIPMTWAECDLRVWLNDTFLSEIFSAQEQAMVVTVTNINKNNPHYGTKGGADTTDKIFFLSTDEIDQYFPDSESRRAKPTAYAKAQGAYVNDTNGNTWWWLRTPGVRPIDVCGVSAYGNVSGYGSRDVNRPSGALRPALWLSIDE